MEASPKEEGSLPENSCCVPACIWQEDRDLWKDRLPEWSKCVSSPTNVSYVGIGELRKQLTELQDEVQQQCANLALRVDGLVEGVQEVADRITSERNERLAAVTDARSSLQEECFAAIAKLEGIVETTAEGSVRKTDNQWLQVSANMVSLSETCGHLSAEISRVADRTIASLEEDCSQEETLCLPQAFVRLRQIEHEVPLLAKAIMSTTQDVQSRLSEERTVRRAAEAVLDARIKHIERQVASCRRRQSFGGCVDTPQSPVLVPCTPAARRSSSALFSPATSPVKRLSSSTRTVDISAVSNNSP